MKFKKLAETFQKIEEETSQNKMIKTLARALKKMGEDEISTACYFAVGQVYPGYEDTTLGMGGKNTQASIALASGKPQKKVSEEMKKTGDLGTVAAKLVRARKNKFKKYFQAKNCLTIKDVERGLKKIGNASGQGSEETKKKTLAGMLVEATKTGRKYIARLATGTMRLGMGDMTLLDAISTAFFGDKTKRPELERAYNVSSDIGHLAHILKKSGMKGVKRIRISLNRPIKPMLAQRVDEITDIKDKAGSEKIAAEEKYDGQRIQAHKNGDKVRLFSRRLTDVTDQYPEIIENVRKHVKAEKAVLDGEAVAYDFNKKRYYEFQKIMSRRRKYDVEEYRKKFPVKYMVFDILYADGHSLMRKPYPKRRKKLEEIIGNYKYIALTGREVSSDLNDIIEFFEDCLDRNLEGIVCKSTSKTSYYRAGAREWSWIKWKKEYSSELSDTFDLVVVGAFAGQGARTGTYGAILCAAYNKDEDEFETLCKIGSGFTDKQLEELPKKMKEYASDEKPARVKATVNPDQWFKPGLVVEAIGSEITKSPTHTAARKKGKGLALRFPRFKKWREDKKPGQATTIKEIKRMYENQKK